MCIYDKKKHEYNITRLDSFWLLLELPELAWHPRSPRLHACAAVIESP